MNKNPNSFFGWLFLSLVPFLVIFTLTAERFWGPASGLFNFLFVSYIYLAFIFLVLVLAAFSFESFLKFSTMAIIILMAIMTLAIFFAGVRSGQIEFPEGIRVVSRTSGYFLYPILLCGSNGGLLYFFYHLFGLKKRIKPN